jgi:hypothetical protein
MSTYLAKVYRQSFVILNSTLEAIAPGDDSYEVRDDTTPIKIRRLQNVSVQPEVAQTGVFILSSATSSILPVFFDSELSQDYRELGEALNQLRDLADQDEWKIDGPVYYAASFVAAELMDRGFPVPRVFNHGPHSVVFNWAHGSDNLYLTVSADRMSALISSPERIKRRIEYPTPDLMKPSIMLSSITSAYLGQPIAHVITGSVTDPLELVG